MKLFDSHCHFKDNDEESIRHLLVRAKETGVEALMAIGGSIPMNESVQVARHLAEKDPALPHVAIAMGLDREELERIGLDACMKYEIDLSAHPNAIGEIGLDFHYSPETRGDQIALFAKQLEIAHAQDLPVVIHTREADDDTLALLREIPSRGIIHCYTGTPEGAKQFLELGFYISISGIVTFRAAENVRVMARTIPDDRILIETDAPFLAPVPMRGQENEPAFVAHTCAFLAAQRGIDPDAFAAITFANAERVLSAAEKTPCPQRHV